jgi:hypothetical protein
MVHEKRGENRQAAELRTYSERPRRGAPEPRDELPPFH